ncbi:MAG: hypothetical protein EHM61_17390 [Acidobacteria bacterium]|nr:MAG: hypothetical protein EHM61_17390 [Acidobacteriota bacterium]
MHTRQNTPVAGLQALLKESLDYAGLFPPAKLPLETAVENYAKYKSAADAWLLSRFVCPVSRLAELDAAIPLFARTSPPLVSALALPCATWKEFVGKIDESLQLIVDFERAHSPRVQVDSLEVALPADLTATAGRMEIGELIVGLAEAVELSGISPLTPFFEVAAKDWDVQVPATVRALAKHNAGWRGKQCRRAAFKLRTGGLTADAFPSVDEVTGVITTCLDSGVRFKCTAGLHHPVRQYDQSVGTRMHGFLNIFSAAVLLHARALERADLPALLEDEQVEHFRFDATGFSWNGIQATVEETSEARYDLFVSFGSCSFEEPLEDLRAFGLL